MRKSGKTLTAQELVDKYKAANKNTVKKIARYDSVAKTWYYDVIKVDENSKDFANKYVKSEVQLRHEKKIEKQKNAPVSNLKIREKAAPTPKRPKSEMRKNVLRLANAGLKSAEIAKMYDCPRKSVSVALCKEKNNY